MTQQHVDRSAGDPRHGLPGPRTARRARGTGAEDRPGAPAPDGVPPARTRTDLWWFALLTVAITGVALLVAGLLGPITEFPARTWFIVGTSGPTLAALVLRLAGRRRPGRGAGPVLRGVPRWGVAALVLGAAPTLVAVTVVAVAGGGPPLDPGQPARLVAGVGGPLIAVVLFLVAGPLAEEFGWRGHAQPRLRRLLSPVATSAVLGCGWAVWHVPLFFLEGTTQSAMGITSPQAALFFLSFLPLSYLFWYVSERLGGGVASAVLLHTTVNATPVLLGNDRIGTAAVSAAVLTLLAVAVHRHTRRSAPIRAGAS